MANRLLLAFLVCFCCVDSKLSVDENEYQSWVSDPHYSLFPILPNVMPQSTNEMCRMHSQLYLANLYNKTLWATQIWDSSAKAAVGVFGGNIYEFGNFDECLKIDAPFRVQYCLAHVSANISSKFWNAHEMKEHSSVTMSSWAYLAKSRIDSSKVPRDVLSWGLCIPAACTSSEAEEAINSHLSHPRDDSFNETTFRVSIKENFCTKADEPKQFSPGSIAFCVVSFILILLTASSTLVDFIPKSKKIEDLKIYRMFMLFSIKQNHTQVFSTEAKTKNALHVFHGIKFLSMVAIVSGHRVGVTLSLSAINYDYVEDSLINEQKMFVLQTDLVVDTFFFISGLLACYFLMQINSHQFLNPIFAIVTRLFRIAPLYFFIIWYQGTIAFNLGSGPLWNALAKNETKFCSDNWWTNVLFVNNYIKVEEMCMPHSWFLPCEVHFFIMAAFLVPIIVKWQIFGYGLLATLTVASAVVPAVFIYNYNMEPVILFFFDFFVQPRKDEVFNTLYIKSHNRASTYLIGVITGLFLHHSKDSKKRITMKTTLVGCFISLVFVFAPMAYSSMYYDLTRPYSAVEAAILGPLRRIFWATGLMFFTLAHRFGTIPLVDMIFSSRVAVFLSRITYGIYLIHFNFITSEVLTSRYSKVFTVKDVVLDCFGDVLKAGFVTVILLFVLEVPLKRFMREIVFAKKIKKLEKPQEPLNVFTIRL